MFEVLVQRFHLYYFRLPLDFPTVIMNDLFLRFNSLESSKTYSRLLFISRFLCKRRRLSAMSNSYVIELIKQIHCIKSELQFVLFMKNFKFQKYKSIYRNEFKLLFKLMFLLDC